MSHFDGPCPALTCLETGPHTHAACAECGAFRHGNVFQCRTCNVVTNAEWAAIGVG